MKTFTPCNRHLLIEPFTSKETKEEQDAILLPDEYNKAKVKQEEYSLYKVIQISNDLVTHENAFNCIEEGDLILADNSMVKEVKTVYGTHYFILNNYVLAVYK